jgi:hypothetical protein
MRPDLIADRVKSNSQTKASVRDYWARHEPSRAHGVREMFAGVDDLSTLALVEEDTKDDTDTGSPSTLYNF